jgi:hypothetical protein
MGKHKKHAHMTQETWMVGNFITVIQGIHFFHHGLEESTCNRGRGGGAATALGPEACNTWVEAGMHQHVMPGDMGDGCAGAMLGMDLNFREGERFKKITLINVRAPHAKNKMTEEIQTFHNPLKDAANGCRQRG